MSGLRVHMLGPFGVGVDGADLALTTARLRSMLAILALNPGRPVSWEQLGTAVSPQGRLFMWDSIQPASKPASSTRSDTWRLMATW
ncbi:hypothetical protein SAMN05216298_0312 [Glycomyces sambucus]|uniref:Transcriptional regulatory protein, C terminal n=1 Tax=Glycomyces sambucus TaxID=380244 RepID=A0A1G9CFQ4_9ACTN|nr:hypothetical protein [Glycomyces sambucus]SDK50501.1 hypothetical protein SAMN05216298_0312 [Glycomyces sambucus]